MSRYPSEDVARFDQQFSETEGERNERLRRKRLVEPFGRQPNPVTVTIHGDEIDVMDWLRHLERAAGYKGDNVERQTDSVLHKHPLVTKSFRIFPRAVND